METLERFLSAESRPSKQLIVYAPEETGTAEQFASRNVAVDHRRLPPGGAEPFVVVREHGAFLGAVELDALETLLEPPIRRPGAMDDLSAGYRALFEVLDESVFTARDRRQLLATSREFEDRALRVGRGTLCASFQSLSVFEAQADVYRHLAGETELDIHVYGAPDWTPPEIGNVTYHPTDDGAIARHWILAFDGGEQSCALVAREDGDGRYTGCWSYDPDLVAAILADLEAVDG